MSWPPPNLPASGSAVGAASDLGTPIRVPAGSTNFVLKSAGNGAIGDTIRAIRFINTGTATTVTLTDGDGTPYPDPNGSQALVANPYNARQIQGASAAAAVPDYIMYNQPSYSGAWKVSTGADVALDVFCNVS